MAVVSQRNQCGLHKATNTYPTPTSSYYRWRWWGFESHQRTLAYLEGSTLPTACSPQ